MFTFSAVCLQFDCNIFLFFLLQIESMDHCDFVPLRNMLIRTHLQDLKEVTNNVHYENYRCRKLAGVAGGSTDKIPNKVNYKISLTA